VGVACLLLAVKYQDNTRTPGMHRLQHWTWITDDAYTPQQLREMELFVPTQQKPLQLQTASRLPCVGNSVAPRTSSTGINHFQCATVSCCT